MSYHRKVIYVSLGILLGVTLLTAIIELLDGNQIRALEIGVVALGFSLFEAVVLLLIALVVRVGRFGEIEEHVLPPADILDASGTTKKKLTSADRAKAFLAAAGLVLLVGGSLCYGSMAFGSMDLR